MALKPPYNNIYAKDKLEEAPKIEEQLQTKETEEPVNSRFKAFVIPPSESINVLEPVKETSTENKGKLEVRHPSVIMPRKSRTSENTEIKVRPVSVITPEENKRSNSYIVELKKENQKQEAGLNGSNQESEIENTPENEIEINESLESEKELKAELEKVKIELLSLNLKDQTEDQKENEQERAGSMNELIKGAFEKVIKSQDSVEKVNSMTLQSDGNEHFVLKANVSVKTKGWVNKFNNGNPECKIIIVFENRKKYAIAGEKKIIKNTIGIMQNEVDTNSAFVGGVKKEIGKFLDKEERNERFSEELEKYIEQNNNNNEVGEIYIKGGELGVEFKHKLAEAVNPEGNSEEKEKLLDKKDELEKKLNNLLKQITESSEKAVNENEQDSKENPAQENIEIAKGENIFVKADEKLEEIKQIPVEPVEDPKIEIVEVKKIEPVDIVENSEKSEFIKQIKEGTKLSYEDKAIGGIYTVEKLPTEESENKYILVGENGMIFKIKEDRLNDMFEKNQISLHNDKENPAETIEIKEIEEETIRKIKHGVFGPSFNNLQKIKNEKMDITFTYPDTWEKVRAVLDLPRNKFIGIVQIWERWTKNPERKNLQNIGLECLLTLGEAMKIEKEDKNEIVKIVKQEENNNK